MKLQRRSYFGWGPTPARSAPCRNGIVVHYDGAPHPRHLDAQPHDKCVDYWVWCHDFHIGPKRRWKDIGYSFAICPHGIVMEGRGFGREQAAQPGGNTTWTSCTFMLGEGEGPSDKQLVAFKEFRAWLRAEHGVGTAIRGHRDFLETSCPGAILYKMLKDGKLAGKAPASKPATIRRGDHGPWVGKAQGRLTYHGYPCKVDNDFGSQTDAKTKAFQKAHKLKADGIIGPKTWPPLNAAKK